MCLVCLFLAKDVIFIVEQNKTFIVLYSWNLLPFICGDAWFMVASHNLFALMVKF